MTMSFSAEALRGRYGHLDGGELLAALLGDGGPLGRGGTALVSSFGTESVVLLHMAARVDPSTPVIFWTPASTSRPRSPTATGWSACSA
jgi:phosphoadenosine phosphosulfate reductase